MERDERLELRNQINELELRIGNLLVEFTNSTGLRVRGLYVDTVYIDTRAGINTPFYACKLYFE